MLCAKCSNYNPAEASFCVGCGAKLELDCPTCKAPASAGSRFCKECGAANGPAKAAASTTVSSTKSQIIVATDGAASEAIDGARKTVTALYAVLTGTTKLMEELDPEEAYAIINPALQLMIDAVHQYDGYVVDTFGDDFIALFGAPVAHEDHPQRAVHAALAARDNLGRRGEELRLRGGVGAADQNPHGGRGDAVGAGRRVYRVFPHRACDQRRDADAGGWRWRTRSWSARRRGGWSRGISSCAGWG